jgi:hypothetical protein
LRLLSIRKMFVALMQPVLCFPRVGNHRRRLPRLPSFEVRADRRAMMRAPRGLHEHVPTMTIPRLRDRAFAFAIATRVLTRDQAEIRRQLRRPFEAPPIDNFRGQHHRALPRNAAEALEPTHHRRQRRQFGESRDLPIEFVAPLQLVREQRMILA